MDHLLQTSIRSVLLAAVAGLGLWRVKSASVRHAIWTLVTASMLVQIAIGPLLLEIPLRVLHAVEPVAIAFANGPTQVVGSSEETHAVLSWGRLAAVVYFCGLLFFAARLVFALVFARRLLRTSEPLAPGRYESHRIAAPLTIGGAILLPLSWSSWDAAKLQSVLAHEEAHVRRHDWAVAVMARLNRCVFWFHPLAWWLERQLAQLAEQACDDAALAVIQNRQQYAQALLDIARSIHLSKGRLLALPNVVVPMAKEANVETRIDRILDETRRIPKALGRRGWAALAIFAAPLIYVTAAIQLAPAQTVMAIPPSVPPQPLTSVVMVAQVPAPPETPAPTPPIQAPPQPPAPPRPRSQAEGVGGPIYIPKIYNARQSQEAQAPQEQTPDPAPPLPKPPVEKFTTVSVADFPVGSSIHVAVTSLRITTISIPLDASEQCEVSARITTLEGKFVSSFDVLADDYRDAVEKNIVLKAGTYELYVLVKNLKDGKVTTTRLNFEVE